jgi:predicted signal transduction protein with EAL and GGDEF domain
LVAERIRAVLSEPYQIRGTEVFVGTSIGIATSTSPDESPEELLRNADLAMYQSKTDGRNRYTLFESKMHDTLIKRVQIESDMRTAIQQKQFELHYQPIIVLGTGRTIGTEALLRWNHPELGQVSPADFIPVAEETGLIIPIGNWVLEEACRQASEWRAGSDDGNEFSITVNISSRQFADSDLFETVRTALANSGLPPRCLVL